MVESTRNITLGRESLDLLFATLSNSFAYREKARGQFVIINDLRQKLIGALGTIVEFTPAELQVSLEIAKIALASTASRNTALALNDLIQRLGASV